MPKKATPIVVAKKAVKKTTTKAAASTKPEKAITKKAMKKSVVKAVATEPLRYADNETSFWVADGKILNSLVALHEALVVMDKETFAHHVSKDKNDFAQWVEEVLGDSTCAADLKKAKTPATAKTVVAKSLRFYSY